MDPPGKVGSPNGPQQDTPPQPFEIALVRKLESKTTGSVRDVFLLLDVDGDGRVTTSDVRVVCHNELGLDLTKEQEEILFARSQQLQHDNKENQRDGMGYAAFAKYYNEVSSATFPTSQSGLAAAVGFQSNSNNDSARNNSEMAIHLQPQTIIHQRRLQLRNLLTAHSSREGGGKSGMKDTSLFLAMDVHRSGKVTMQEFLDWLNTVGYLEWSIDDLKQVVLVDSKGDKDGISDVERMKLEMLWFGEATKANARSEAGMTEHEFADFVDSLDSE